MCDPESTQVGLLVSKLRIIMLALLLAGCTTIAIDLPPVSETSTGIHDTGRVIWHDLLTTTPEASRRFYGELFGWTFETPSIYLGFGDDEDYMLIRHNGRLIGGMLNANTLGRDTNISQWMTMISVDDIDAAVARVTANGAVVLTQPTELMSRGSLAVLEGPTGALFAMIQTRDGDPPAYEPEHNGFLWDELWTNDVDKASLFYERVFGYVPDDHAIEDSSRTYRVLRRGDKPTVGVMANPFEDEHPVWVNYLRVEDPAAITSRVTGLGGRIIVEAQARDIGGYVAFVAGPSGAGIALQTWPLKEETPE